MPPDQRGRPFERIAGALRERIASGELRPGDRVPSTRQLVRDWGVAMATASRALAVLRDEGLVVTRPGAGTVVRVPERPPGRRVRSADHGLSRAQIVAAALARADADGLEAVTMRSIAGELGVTPMSLYHHVAGREELEYLMIRTVFRAHPLPGPGLAGWRSRLESVYRLQWRLYRRHPWLAELLSVTRPPLVPEAMVHGEWTLQALDELGLPPAERTRAALALPALVRGLALGAAGELRAERETRMRNAQWWSVVDAEATALVESGRLPRLAAVGQAAVVDVDGVFDHALTAYLDGIAQRHPRSRTTPTSRA
ncbi:GntR family transcriptional regulator [Pseudonocardia kunmingensis]|uniref:TetR family transcriptional regulator n=1 Tax=Pseudonocardia kunmingensis TaxID=630975 RepID=A0A543DAB3_9PSEU|nr:GntR family transcriptional regulator [Pseudonocardia kunmingensis]TQM06256.1 TetR family transcriptional regulator [Pseudonocardia kunmingensis]